MGEKWVNPLAITMWDFSWIERNWPGAGYESFDEALDGLVERGYNAIRIDAFPHLLYEDPYKEWTLKPVWYSNEWGSPYLNRVTLYPAIILFIKKCKERKIKVALSSWFREDEDDVRMKINSPEKMADIWLKVIDLIEEANLLDVILYVDLCNEWPGDIWAPYYKDNPTGCTWGYWHTDQSMDYMKKAVERIRSKYPLMPLCFSFDGIEYDYYKHKDLSFFDLLEHHIWAVKLNQNEFYGLVGSVEDGRYTEEAYHQLSKNARKVYDERPLYWQNLLVNGIKELADAAKVAKLPIITTECWGIVDYKDYPLLDWDWVKELCALGTKTALYTNQWAALATSNFCGPQFVGMWRDIAWHQELTNAIKSHQIPEENISQRLLKTMKY